MSTSHSKWTAANLPAQHGRTIVVTGATSGLGAVTARELARAGAHVVLAVRDTRRGEALARNLPGSTEVRRLDLADLSSVRGFAADWEGPLDVLVNNAGVMAIPEARTADGFEMQLGTNHLGPFALTNLLLPHLTDRVVTVASNAHRRPGVDIDFDDLDARRQSKPYSPWRAYQQSKLANLLFTRELQRRLTEAGSALTAHAAHPGYAATNLQSGTAGAGQRLMMAIANRLIAQSEEQGALPSLYAATQPLPGASYTGPDGRGELRGYPSPARLSPHARDDARARRLWDASEQLTGVGFPAALSR
ncbi:oxidoreductase [Kitasatospora sp. NPDC096128]|uniref:oxidoreductase n=1 Tax=Kitasatospora sp. NPDC096128 TaxID=3155547 RepID=UPI00332F8157